MDDFLHNLRTGKNKPFDRTRKQFDNNGYKNPDRQGPNDNRRKDAFQRTPPVDHFPAIKILLGDITEGQRRLADIFERRATAEERIASALEKIALSFFEKNPAASAAGPGKQTDPDFRIIPETVKPMSVSQPGTSDAISGAGKTDGTDAIRSGLDRESIIEMIGALRKEEMSYEKIARSLEKQGIPTFSGKGAWHSQTVSKLCHQFHPSLCS
ncbi:MAG: hypothetical protein V1844_17980 [Pseudomonadota bacterium]